MMKIWHEIRKNIKSLITARMEIVLCENQYFCETPKAYEIWADYNNLPRMIKRINKKSVLWVIEY